MSTAVCFHEAMTALDWLILAATAALGKLGTVQACTQTLDRLSLTSPLLCIFVNITQ